MNTTNKINLKENSHVIASNGKRFLVANENIDINDIYDYAIIVDENGVPVSEPQMIGVITKFGYWKEEDFNLTDLKNKIYTQKIITDAIIGFEVAKEFSNNLLKLSVDTVEIDEKELLVNLSFYSLFSAFGLIEDEYEAMNKFFSSYNNSDIAKMGGYIYTTFIEKIIETKDKFKAMDYIRNADYSKLYSIEVQKEYSSVLNGEFHSTNKNFNSEEKFIIKVLESVFFSILNANDYEKTLIKSSEIDEVNSTIVSIIGLIAGLLYGEENIPIDWIINLKSENDLRDLSSDFSETILSNMYNK